MEYSPHFQEDKFNEGRNVENPLDMTETLRSLEEKLWNCKVDNKNIIRS